MPAAMAWLVRVAAVYTVVDLLVPRRHDHFVSGRVDAVADGIGFAAAAAAAALMLLLAGALRRRRRRAWTLMVAVAVLGIAAHVQVRHWSVVAVNVVLLGVLLWVRRDFTAVSDRHGRLAAVRVLLVTGGVCVVVGMVLTRHARGVSFWDRLYAVGAGMIGFAPDLSFRHRAFSDLTATALVWMGALTALLTLAALLAPARKPARLAAADEQRLRELLRRHGDRDSLGYFALRRDKAVVWSKSGKAAVVHRVLGGVSLASGDPIGDPEAWPGAIEAWLGEADRFGWVPGALGVSEEGAVIYKRAGLDSWELGDEAVIDLSGFSLDGRPMRVVRQAVNRVARAGYRVEVRRQGDLSEPELGEVVAAAEAMRTEEVERGFSMALCRLGDPADPDIVIARVWDGAGRLVCVLGFVPWGRVGLSLDLMRRARDSENGTIEFAVVSVLDYLRERGLTKLSLNFAVFRSVFERGGKIGAGPVLRVWLRVLLFFSRWYQIESLYRANAKYQPRWHPRYVCFERAGDLPRVALAAGEAEAFIAFPRLGWLAR